MGRESCDCDLPSVVRSIEAEAVQRFLDDPETRERLVAAISADEYEPSEPADDDYEVATKANAAFADHLLAALAADREGETG